MSGFNYTDGSREYSQQYPKSFVSARAFGFDFFTYTTSMNSSFVRVGTLGLVTTNPALCPAGRVLHATGAKLYPNVNPMNTFPSANTYTGVTPTFYASIASGTRNLNVNTLLTGTIFIGMVVNGAAPGTYVVAQTSGSPGSTGDYTVNITQLLNNSYLTGSVQNGTLLTGPKFLLGVYDPISQLRGFIDPTLSTFAKYDQLLPNFFNLGPTANTAVYGAAQAATPLGGLAGKLTVSDAGLSASTTNGGTIQAGAAASGTAQINGGGSAAVVNISTSACTATSRIFLTGSISARVPSIESVSAGTFAIRTPDSQNVTWLIVN
jgi:hypothetical protein